MSQLRSRLNNLYTDYDSSSATDFPWTMDTNRPKTNLYENRDHFEIIAEVPGISKENLNIKIQGNYLEISGSRDSDRPDGYKVHKTEREIFSFSRSFTLPADVDATKVEATLKDGILHMTLSKSEEAKPKRISIN
jgi:HSP20 family protein